MVKWCNPGHGIAPSPTPQCSNYWKGSLRVTFDYNCLLYFTLLLQIFKTMEKSEFCVLIKHCFLRGKIRFKQSSSFIRVIQTLLHRKQRLTGGMMTLNAVALTQRMLNALFAQIRQLSRKTPKNIMYSFWPIINWSCVR